MMQETYEKLQHISKNTFTIENEMAPVSQLNFFDNHVDRNTLTKIDDLVRIKDLTCNEDCRIIIKVSEKKRYAKRSNI